MAVLLLFASCGTPPDLDIQRLATGSFDTVAEEVRRSELYFYPGRASRLGWVGYDDRIPERDSESVGIHRERLEELLLRLQRMPRTFLDQQRWVEWLWLEGQVRAELIGYRFRSLPERDPGFYLDPQIEGLASLFERPGDPTLTPRLEAILTRLEGMPSQLAAGQEALTQPETWHCRAARARCRAFIEPLGQRVGGMLDRLASNPGRRVIHDRLARARHEALSALEAFADHIDRVLLPSATPGFPLGTKTLRQILAFELLIEEPLDELLDFATSEALAARAIIEERLPDGFQPSDWPALTGGAPDADLRAWLETPRAEAERLGESLEAFLLLADDEPWVLRVAGPWEEVLQPRGTLEGMEDPEISRSVLVVPPPTSGLPLGRADWTLTLLREGARGRLLVWKSLQTNPDAVRRANPSPALFEAWGGFLEWLLVSWLEAPLEGDLALALQRRRLIEACRLAVTIRLHSGTLSLTEARDFLQRQAFLPEPVAAREVDALIRDPLSGMRLLLERQLIRLFEDYYKNRGPFDFDADELTRELMSHAGLPIPCIRRLMLPGDPGQRYQ